MSHEASSMMQTRIVIYSSWHFANLCKAHIICPNFMKYVGRSSSSSSHHVMMTLLIIHYTGVAQWNTRPASQRIVSLQGLPAGFLGFGVKLGELFLPAVAQVAICRRHMIEGVPDCLHCSYAHLRSHASCSATR